MKYPAAPNDGYSFPCRLLSSHSTKSACLPRFHEIVLNNNAVLESVFGKEMRVRVPAPGTEARQDAGRLFL